MNDAQLLSDLARADACAPSTAMPTTAWTIDVARSEIDRRIGMGTQEPTTRQRVKTRPTGPETASTPQRQSRSVGARGPWRAAAALAATLAVVAMGIALSGDDEAVFGTDAALAVIDDYVDAHNSGDIDAFLALFTPDATFEDVWVDLEERSMWESRFAWELAYGEVTSPLECEVLEEVPGTSIRLNCAHEVWDAVGLLTETAIPVTSTFTIEPDGIVALRETIGRPSYADVNAAYNQWVEGNHPDVTATSGDYCFDGCGSIAEGTARGETRAALAQEFFDATGG